MVNNPNKENHLNFISAIKDRIEVLALQDSLLTKESKLCQEFKDLFDPIPHMDDLPSDFWLKSNSKIQV